MISPVVVDTEGLYICCVCYALGIIQVLTSHVAPIFLWMSLGPLCFSPLSKVTQTQTTNWDQRRGAAASHRAVCFLTLRRRFFTERTSNPPF